MKNIILAGLLTGTILTSASTLSQLHKTHKGIHT